MNTLAEAPPKQERSEQDLITGLQDTVSDSRLSLFLRCRLKFYFRYVLKLQKPKTPALHLGNAVHAVLKVWNRLTNASRLPIEATPTFALGWHGSTASTTKTGTAKSLNRPAQIVLSFVIS